MTRPFQNMWGDFTYGEGTTFGAYVEFAGVAGKDCQVEAYALIPPGVILGDRVFVGPHVCFTNDKYPFIGPFSPEPTVVEDDVVIGANCTILPVKIGQGAVIGAGSVVTKDVPAGEIWVGNPARKVDKKE